MERKKKEEPEIYHTPFGSAIIKPFEYKLGPYSILPDISTPDISTPDITEITSLNDTYRQYITTANPGISLTYTGSTDEIRHVYYPSTHWEPYSTTLNYEDFMKKIGKEEEAKMTVNVAKYKNKSIYFINDAFDLVPEKILTALFAIKHKLLYESAPIRVKEFQCGMTPLVKKSLIQANKRAKMYGKPLIPIVARFDEYANRLPDQIEIENQIGVNVIILDSDTHGELYLEMAAIYDS